MPFVKRTGKLRRYGKRFTTKKAVTTIYDKNGQTFAKVSPNSVHGINYVIVYPRFSDEKLKMLTINHRGEIITETSNIDKMSDFKQNFIKAVKFDNGRTPGIKKGKPEVH